MASTYANKHFNQGKDEFYVSSHGQCAKIEQNKNENQVNKSNPTSKQNVPIFNTKNEKTGFMSALEANAKNWTKTTKKNQTNEWSPNRTFDHTSVENEPQYSFQNF